MQTRIGIDGEEEEITFVEYDGSIETDSTDFNGNYLWDAQITCTSYFQDETGIYFGYSISKDIQVLPYSNWYCEMGMANLSGDPLISMSHRYQLGYAISQYYQPSVIVNNFGLSLFGTYKTGRADFHIIYTWE